MKPHFLGEYTSLSAVWKRYPNGGGFGDYIILNGEKVKWDEYNNSWGNYSDTGGSVDSLRFMQIEQELYVMAPGELQKIRCFIYDRYMRDVSSEYSNVDVERDSNDYYSDQVWNEEHGKNKGFRFNINFSDLNFREESRGAKFTIIAKRRNSIVIGNIEIK